MWGFRNNCGNFLAGPLSVFILSITKKKDLALKKKDPDLEINSLLDMDFEKGLHLSVAQVPRSYSRGTQRNRSRAEVELPGTR